VDIKGIPEINELAFDPASGLQLGAGVPCCRIYEDPSVRETFPALVDSTSLIGSIQIQGRASVGGNLCNASPAADTVPTLIVLGARAQIAGPDGRREVPVESFCTGPGQTVLGEGEFLVSVHIPTPEPNSGAFFLRFIPRNEMDIAVVNAAASVTLAGDGKLARAARIAVGAVAPTPLFLPEAAEALTRNGLSDEAIDRAASIAVESARPISDMRGTARQRRHLTGVLTRRAIAGAIARANAS
jgi:carbon-monoxide dehydrogenase medium subunit